MTAEREVVKMALKEAKLYKKPAPDGVVLVRADTLTPEPVTWVWPGWVPCGKVALLAGAPGVGKTTVAMAMAATVTKGGSWPDGLKSPVGDVLIWTGEDDPADTLVPRLIGAGADLARSKSNVGPDEGGFTYTLDECEARPGIWATRVAWGEALAGSARELLAEPKNPEEASSGAAAKAEQFLREELSGPGWYPASKVLEAAKDAGISEKTLRRTFKCINGTKNKGGMNDGWYWKLPHPEGGQWRHEDDEDAIPKTIGNFGIFEGAVGIFEVHATAEVIGYA